MKGTKDRELFICCKGESLVVLNCFGQILQVLHKKSSFW